MFKYKHNPLTKMTVKKDRVIAIDYFRGICILLVLINHAAIFSSPLTYLTGTGGSWTSAAEMFFLLSGITLGIVRGSKIKSDFRTILRKTWRRAGTLYLVNITIVVLSLCLALFLTGKSLSNYVPGNIPNYGGFKLLSDILTFKYSLGWASFLMYYSVFLIFAPFALYALKSRYWPVVPFASIALFALQASKVPTASHLYTPFVIWQVYFFIGLTIANSRLPILGYYNSLKPKVAKRLSTSVLAITGGVLALSFMLTHQVTHRAAQRLDAAGWLPHQLQAALSYVLNNQTSFNTWLLDGRTGLLRPVVSVMVLASAYLVYQRYKKPLLAHTGKFVNTMGRETLWIFAAQALVIPILAALPLQRSLINNFTLTSVLIVLMWLITQRKAINDWLGAYARELKASFIEAKYGYIYRSQDN